jgi:hypothetical protein
VSVWGDAAGQTNNPVAQVTSLLWSAHDFVAASVTIRPSRIPLSQCQSRAGPTTTAAVDQYIQHARILDGRVLQQSRLTALLVQSSVSRGRACI